YRCGLRRRDRPQHLAAGRASRLPVLGSELSIRARTWRDIELLGVAPVQTFAVDGHRRRDDHLLDPVTYSEDLFKEDRRAERVDRRVALDLVHRLANPNRCREVCDSIDPSELRMGVQVLGNALVDLRDRDAVRAALAGVDRVAHLAAAVGVGQSMYEIERYTSVNSLGAAVLLEEILAVRDRVG